MKILILGATGMLGSAVYRLLSAAPGLEVHGTARDDSARRRFDAPLASRLLTGVDVVSHDALVRLLAAVRPQAVVNCVGLVKQLAEADDPLAALPINSLLPHRLAALCRLTGARLVHVSTDCVFSGSRGGYVEGDLPDATDLYGRSKLLGEVVDRPDAITLRTSIIGHELAGSRSLVGWFLAQPGPVRGFRRAIFSGLPTVELAAVIRDQVLPRPELHGLYHVAAGAISKYELLRIVADAYGRSTAITPDDDVAIDRSLDPSRFRAATGYAAPDWPELVRRMREFG
jgi:dTDP-4-dehydrorhamnose reductase